MKLWHDCAGSNERHEEMRLFHNRNRRSRVRVNQRWVPRQNLNNDGGQNQNGDSNQPETEAVVQTIIADQTSTPAAEQFVPVEGNMQSFHGITYVGIFYDVKHD